MGNKVPVLILGHPGHELRVFHWVETVKPRVYLLTKGARRNGHYRIQSTTDLLEKYHVPRGSLYGPWGSQEIYGLILDKRYDVFCSMVDELVSDLKDLPVEFLAGDATEGYCTTHDICRLMIGAVGAILRRGYGKDFPIYAFPLMGRPDACPGIQSAPVIRLPLDDQAWKRKYDAAKQYSELAGEVDNAINSVGEAAFHAECLWETTVDDGYDGPPESPPYYETYARKQIDNGRYEEIILYEKHIRPLAEALKAHTDKEVSKLKDKK